jgi:hypothetical protein
MKIAITGHSKSLGQLLFKQLSTDSNNTVFGFSRSNGYDIKNPKNRASIIAHTKEYDFFINLVHNYYHQSDLLFELHQSWTGLDKTIINISSAVVNSDNWALDDYKMMEYKIQKINLENMAKHLNKINTLPTIITYTISEIDLQVDTDNIIRIINEKVY